MIVADRPVRWGFLGAGGIAGKLAQDLAGIPGNVLAAVAARDAGRAADFAGGSALALLGRTAITVRW